MEIKITTRIVNNTTLPLTIEITDFIPGNKNHIEELTRVIGGSIKKDPQTSLHIDTLVDRVEIVNCSCGTHTQIIDDLCEKILCKMREATFSLR